MFQDFRFQIQEFLNQYNYDVRKSKDARWIDQKCTFDVLSLVADCIIEYVANSNNTEFTVTDIWNSEYSIQNVIEIFSKPSPNNKKAKNEYDKYFGQPIKMLAYSNILNIKKIGNRNYYTINNEMILRYISLKESQALEFIYQYTTKVLKDSGLWDLFNNFLIQQDAHSFLKLKDGFCDFTKNYTSINNSKECGRIFTKILNPVAYKNKKLGTIRGRVSKTEITLSDLRYNQFNWRDLYSNKSKFITRKEHDVIDKENKKRYEAFTRYSVNKAKKLLKNYNKTYHDSLSEIFDSNELIVATQAHHIFPESDFIEISNFVENLIALTPNQHFGMTHPNNMTHYVDKQFQHICLLAKTVSIMNNLQSKTEEKFYDFERYKHVLNVGLKTNEFQNINDLDFITIIEKIDTFYANLVDKTKYKEIESKIRKKLPKK